MKKLTKILWGIVLIAAGVLFALNAVGITDVDVFFDGWWTLFIIIPCTVGLFTEHEKMGNLIGLLIGVFLLLSCQDILSFETLWKLAVPVIVIVIGIKLVFGGVFGGKVSKKVSEIEGQSGNSKSCCATFSGQKLNFDGERFEGAELTAVFGGVDCDLRGALIEKDCVIKFSAIFGGIDIRMPDDVNVKVDSNSIFGGVSNKIKYNKESAVTVYLSGTCMFGGVDIK